MRTRVRSRSRHTSSGPQCSSHGWTASTTPRREGRKAVRVEPAACIAFARLRRCRPLTEGNGPSEEDR